MNLSTQELSALGSEFGVSKTDIRIMQREHWKLIFKYFIIGAVTTAGAALLGFLTGQYGERKLINGDTGYGYPYAVAAFGLIPAITYASRTVLPTTPRTAFRLAAVIITIMVAVVTFAIMYDAARPVEYYNSGLLYNAFRKNPRFR